MAMTYTESPPLGEMNTTPLIDVLLVLLIMFIMSVPAASHVIPVDLPRPGDTRHELKIRPENVLSVTTRGELTWNGNIASEREIAATLAFIVHLNPEPLVKFQPEAGAPYGASARAIDLVKRSDLASFAFVGTEQYATFGKPGPAH